MGVAASADTAANQANLLEQFSISSARRANQPTEFVVLVLRDGNNGQAIATKCTPREREEILDKYGVDIDDMHSLTRYAFAYFDGDKLVTRANHPVLRDLIPALMAELMISGVDDELEYEF
jgi:hypothetical protein